LRWTDTAFLIDQAKKEAPASGVLTLPSNPPTKKEAPAKKAAAGHRRCGAREM